MRRRSKTTGSGKGRSGGSVPRGDAEPAEGGDTRTEARAEAVEADVAEDGGKRQAASGDAGATSRLDAVLLKRGGPALLMIAIFAAAMYADYAFELDVCLFVMLAVLTPVALIEFYRMCETSRTSPFTGFGLASCLVLVVGHWLSMPGVMEKFGISSAFWHSIRSDFVSFGLVAAVFGSLWLQATKRDNDRTYESISSTLFGVLYLWFLPSFLVKLRHLGADGTLGGQNWNGTGVWLLAVCVGASKFNDIVAFLFGRKFGKRRLIPRISPKKSLEGALVGGAGGVLFVAVAQGIGVLPFASIWEALFWGVVVTGFAQLGDLAESLLKRASGTKDSGQLIPGFGGILDVLDSILLSTPAAYFLAVLILQSRT